MSLRLARHAPEKRAIRRRRSRASLSCRCGRWRRPRARPRGRRRRSGCSSARARRGGGDRAGRAGTVDVDPARVGVVHVQQPAGHHRARAGRVVLPRQVQPSPAQHVGGGGVFVADEHGRVPAVAPHGRGGEQLAAAGQAAAAAVRRRASCARTASGRSARELEHPHDPVLAGDHTRLPPSSAGALEPRSVSLVLSCSWSVGVKAWRSAGSGSVSSSTLSPKSVVPFQGPLPVSSRMRRPPGSTTAPPRERIAESLA